MLELRKSQMLLWNFVIGWWYAVIGKRPGQCIWANLSLAPIYPVADMLPWQCGRVYSDLHRGRWYEDMSDQGHEDEWTELICYEINTFEQKKGGD